MGTHNLRWARRRPGLYVSTAPQTRYKIAKVVLRDPTGLQPTTTRWYVYDHGELITTMPRTLGEAQGFAERLED